jgi:hypothetical protein
MSTIIAGGSLASLVAADALASAGQRVTLLTDGPRVGGHFAGLTADGIPFDAGLVVFEFGSEQGRQDGDVRGYDPDVRNDCGRFGTVVRRWAEQELGLPLTRLPAMELWHEGTVVPDFVFDTNIHGLARLPQGLRDRIAADVRRLPADREPALHARNKYARGSWDTLDLASASLANHGRVLHDQFIAPFLRNVVGSSGAMQTLARFSRAVWTPMYWPETIRRGLAGDVGAMAATPFHVVAGRPMGEMVTRLSARLTGSPLVTWRTGAISRVMSTARGVAVTIDGAVLDGTELVWGGESGAFHRAAGLPPTPALERERLEIAFVTIDKRYCVRPQTGTMMVPCGRGLPYRVSNQSRNNAEVGSRLRFSMEYTWGSLPNDPAAALRTVIRSLTTLGIIDEPAGVHLHKVMRIEQGLIVPSLANQARAIAARDAALRAGIPVRFVGPAAGFGVASLGDQVVQGLQAAALARLPMAVAA